MCKLNEYILQTGKLRLSSSDTLNITVVSALQQLLPELDGTDVVPSGMTVFDLIPGSVLKQFTRTKLLRKFYCLAPNQLISIRHNLCSATTYVRIIILMTN